MQPRAGVNRRLFVLGGLTVAGAVVTIVFAAAHSDSAPRADTASVVVKRTVVAQPLVPHPTPSDAAQEALPRMTASDLEAECRGYQVERNWE